MFAAPHKDSFKGVESWKTTRSVKQSNQIWRHIACVSSSRQTYLPLHVTVERLMRARSSAHCRRLRRVQHQHRRFLRQDTTHARTVTKRPKSTFSNFLITNLSAEILWQKKVQTILEWRHMAQQQIGAAGRTWEWSVHKLRKYWRKMIPVSSLVTSQVQRQCRPRRRRCKCRSSSGNFNLEPQTSPKERNEISSYGTIVFPTYFPDLLCFFFFL